MNDFTNGPGLRKGSKRISRRLRLEVLERRIVMTADPFELIGLNQLRAEFPFLDGSGVDESRPQSVVVIDGTVDDSHPLLDDQVALNLDFAGRAGGSTSTRPADFHGTHVAGIVAAEDPMIGVAPDARIIGMNVFAGEGAFDSDIVEALRETLRLVDDYNITAVNMSLGSGFYQTPPTASQAIIANLIGQLEDAGVTVVSAAGNSYAGIDSTGFQQNSGTPGILSTINVGAVWSETDPDGDFCCWKSPARRTVDGSIPDPTLFVITAENGVRNDNITSFSQRPPSQLTNTLFAPGAGIVSTAPFAISATGRAESDGTSMASPIVAGAVTLVQHAAEHFGGTRLRPSEVVELLRSTGTVIHDGDDENSLAVLARETQPSAFDFGPEVPFEYTNQAYLRLDVLAAVKALQARYPSDTPLGADTNHTFDTATQISLPSANSFVTVPSAYVVPDRYQSALNDNVLSTGDAAPISGHLGQDGQVNVGPRDVDLYRFVLDIDASLSFEFNGPEAPALRLFSDSGNELAFDGQQTGTLPAGVYFAGISVSPNSTYDPSDGSGTTDGDATGHYTVSVSVQPTDLNGTFDTATNVSVAVAEGTFVQITDGFSTKRFLSGVSTWVRETLGEDDTVDGNDLTIASDVDVYRVTAPTDGRMQVDIDSTLTISSAVDRRTNRRTFIGQTGTDFSLAVFSRDGNGVTSLVASNDHAFATDFFGTPSETRRGTPEYTQNEVNGHGIAKTFFNSAAIVGGSDEDAFLEFDATAGTEYFVAVLSSENTGVDFNDLAGRNQVATPTDYSVFFNFTSFDSDQVRQFASNHQPRTTFVPSSIIPLTTNSEAITASVSLGSDRYSDSELGISNLLLSPGSDDVDLIEILVGESGVLDFALTPTDNSEVSTTLRAFDELGNPLHATTTRTSLENRLQLAVTPDQGPQTIYIGISGAGNDGYEIGRSVSQTRTSEIPEGETRQLDFAYQLLPLSQQETLGNNSLDNAIEVSSNSFVVDSLGTDGRLAFASAADDIDRFIFNAEADSIITASAFAEIETSVRTLVRVRDAAGSLVAESDPDAADSEVSFLATNGDRYDIEVLGANATATGSYALQLSEEADFEFTVNSSNTPSVADQRSSLSSVRITSPLSLDHIEAADLVLTNLGLDPGSDQPRLVDITPQQLERSVDGRTIRLDLGQPGFPDGVYQLQLPALSTNGTVTVDSDSVDRFYKLAGDFDGDAEVGFSDYFRFLSAFRRPSTNDIRFMDLDQSGVIDFPDFLRFLANFRRRVQTGEPPSSVSTAAGATTEILPPPDSALLAALSSDDPDDQPTEATELSINQTAQGEIESAIDVDAYRFEGVAGELVRIFAEYEDPTTTVVPQFTLYGPIFQRDITRISISNNAVIDYFPIVTGTHYVAVHNPGFTFNFTTGFDGNPSVNTTLGEYSLRVSDPNASTVLPDLFEDNNRPSAAPGSQSDKTLTGLTLHDTSDLDWFHLQPTAIGTYEARVQPVAGASLTMDLFRGPDPSDLELVDTVVANGQPASLTDTFAFGDFSEPQREELYVRISSSEIVESYTFSWDIPNDPDGFEPNDSLAAAANLGPLESGETTLVNASFHELGDLDFYSFVPQQDGLLTVFAGGDNATRVTMHLYNQDRAVVQAASPAANNIFQHISYNVTGGETYLISAGVAGVLSPYSLRISLSANPTFNTGSGGFNPTQVQQWLSQRSRLEEVQLDLPQSLESLSDVTVQLVHLGIDGNENQPVALPDQAVSLSADQQSVTIDLNSVVLLDGLYQIIVINDVTGVHSLRLNGNRTNGLFVLHGDFSGDGEVTFSDFLLWLNNFRKPTSEVPAFYDLNDSHLVDFQDFLIFLSQFRKTIPAS